MKVPFLVSAVVALFACTAVAQFDPEQCGPTGGNQVCKNNQCCSQYGWCGTTTAYCRSNLGCNPAFGRCTGATSSAVRVSSTLRSSSVSKALTTSASPSQVSNKNERCGPSYGGRSCVGSIYGSCCSQYGWCGTTTGHCKAGCQSAFGTCSSLSSVRSSSRVPSSTSKSSSVARSSQSTSRASSTSSAVRSSSNSVQSTSRASASSTASSYAIASSSTQSTFSGSSSATSSSSSRAATSSNFGIPSASSTRATSSSATLSVVSSGVIISLSSSSASISASIVSSSLVATPSASGAARIWLSARNPNIDRTSADRLVPANVLTLYYVEQSPGTLSKLDTVTLAADAKGILLEDISTIDAVTCSGSTISITFTDTATANIARNWPAGTLLFTSADGCAPAGGRERGVYSLNNAVASRPLDKRQSLEDLLIQFVVSRKTLAEIIASLVEFIQQLLATASSTSAVVTPTSSADSSLVPTSGISSAVSSVAAAVSSPAVVSTPTAATASSTPMDVQSSSIAPSPSAVAPSNFCLKVITHGVESTGWLVKHSGLTSNGAFLLDPSIGGIVVYVARFSLGDQNTLMVTTPGLDNVKVTGYSRGTSGMFRFNDMFNGFNPTKCSIRTDVAGYLGQQVLKCTGGFLTNPIRTFTGFRHYNKISVGRTNIFGTDDFTTNEDGNFVVDLGVFTGGDCPATSPDSSSDSATPSSSSTTFSLSITDTTSSPSASSSALFPDSPSSLSPSATPAPSSAESSVSPSSLSSDSTAISSSATPAPSSNPVYSNFCLKVLTNGVRSSDWVVKQSNPGASNGAFWLDPVVDGLYQSVSRFSIDAQNVLVVNTPGTVGDMITRYSRGTGGMFRFASPSTTLASNTCSVKTDVDGFLGQPVLKCTGSLTSPSQTFTGFRDQVGINGNGLDYLFGAVVVSPTNPADLIELGLFTGGSCPDASSPVISSDVSATPSSTLAEVVSSSSSTPSTTSV